MYTDREFDFGPIGNRLALYHITTYLRRALHTVATDLDTNGVSRNTVESATEPLRDLLLHVDSFPLAPPDRDTPPEVSVGDYSPHPDAQAAWTPDFAPETPTTERGRPFHIRVTEFIWPIQELLSITEGTFMLGVSKSRTGFEFWASTTEDVLRFDTDVPVVVTASQEVADNAECDMYRDSVAWAQQQALNRFPLLINALNIEVPPWSPLLTLGWPARYTAEYEHGGFVFRLSRLNGTVAFGLDRAQDAVTPVRRHARQ